MPIETDNEFLNRNRKSTLFCLIFGRHENRKWTLDLYNAINNSHYTNPDEITLNTLEDALYMGIKNDVSFILDSVMNLYEHQSTFNPNMPLRQLEYAADLYKKYLAENNLDKFSSKRITIPLAKLVVFYNGTKDEPKETTLKLSDLYPEHLMDVDADIFVTTRMLNINYGCNKELLDACKPLSEYSWAVDTERRHRKTMSTEEAVKKTLEEMPDDFVIKPFLVANKEAVTNSFLTEYDEKLHIENEKNISYEEGRTEGREEAIENIITNMLKLHKTEKEIAEICECPVEEVQKISHKMNLNLLSDQ
ncbi:MAG: hypothetical protein K6G75_06135 [Lachnospiraceae bacterium]|nr:hypothetical protein [Lachnospiraceae bacterium]